MLEKNIVGPTCKETVRSTSTVHFPSSPLSIQIILISKKGIWSQTTFPSPILRTFPNIFLLVVYSIPFSRKKCFLVKRWICLKLPFAESSGVYIRISYFYIETIRVRFNRDDSLFQYKKETVHGLSILSIPDSAYNLAFVLTKRNLYQVNDIAEHETQVFLAFSFL